jgi:hypothetical protein
MRKTITALVLAVAAAAGIVTASLPASASANWKAQTCAAFTAYQAHPSQAGLAALVTDSVHLDRSYLKADAGQLYADASSPSKKAARYAAKDAQYLAEDCAATNAAQAADVTMTHAVRTLPSWAHWKPAPRGACSNGAGVIVWAGHGDGVLICSSGQIETP